MSGRRKSRQPRLLSSTLGRFLEQSAPRTPLAAAQAIWPTLAGPEIAEVTEVISEKEGLLTIRCQSSVWAQQLDMMAPQFLGRLSKEMGPEAPVSIRFLT